MSTAPELDPYLLPLPTPHSPVVLPHLTTALHAHFNARYADPIWPLSPLTENPSAAKKAIHWRNCPAVFQDEIRLVAWSLINGQLRPTFLEERGTTLRARISLTEVHNTVAQWMRLAAWLDGRGVHSLAGCDTGVLHDYGQHLLSDGHSRRYVLRILIALTRLWAFDQLNGRPSGIGRPPWDDVGADDYLPAAASVGGENETAPLAEQTMGPLLVWAMRMVDDLAEDILAAWAERQRLVEAARTNTAAAAGRAALHVLLDPLIAAEAPLPAIVNRSAIGLARTYIGGLTGASRGQIDKFARREGLVAAVAQRPGSCPLDVAVTGRIGGRLWRETLDFTEAITLMRHLGTAAFVVCAYLTGMRPGEILGLRAGCCPDPKPDASGKVGRHVIRSNEYKTATDEHGNHQSAGVERDVPWVAIIPVVNAIRVVERMVPDGHLLFDHDSHDLHTTGSDTGSLKLDALRARIEAFVAWANAEAATHGLPNETIPPDPNGKIGTVRFRRSLAWHIARRPNGLVALAIQYGHLRTTFVSGGYASRSRDGIHDLIDIETVRAVAVTVADLHDDLGAGGRVSGPAARRAIKAAAIAPRFAGTVITTTTARRLIANEDAMIYDNPHAVLLCHYKRATALCHRDGVKDTPSLDHCVPGCGNVIRTDRHALQLRERATALDDRAAQVPGPMGERLRANADKLRGYADSHDRTRITVSDDAG
ncbi:MAG TPA: integrase [Umezawaea sp.]|nr:integrase [Umezawaea sp.]